jgi:hypothetical protein
MKSRREKVYNQIRNLDLDQVTSKIYTQVYD